MDKLATSWNVVGVVESFVVAMVGSWVSLTIAERSLAHYLKGKDPRGAGLRSSFGAASISLGGCGIWGMHFVGMQSLTIEGTAIYFDIPLTLVSLVAVVAMVYLSFMIVAKDPALAPQSQSVQAAYESESANKKSHVLILDTIKHLVMSLSRYNIAGGLICGTGVCVMHFVGMVAMRLPDATMKWDFPMIVLSCAIALVVSTIGLLLVFFQKHRGRLVAAFVVAMAVCTMHYVGMYAVTYHAKAESEISTVVISTSGVALITTGVLTLCLVITQLDSVQSMLVRQLMIELAQKDEKIKSARAATKKAKMGAKLLTKYLKMITYGRPYDRPYTNLLLLELDRTIGPVLLSHSGPTVPRKLANGKSNSKISHHEQVQLEVSDNTGGLSTPSSPVPGTRALNKYDGALVGGSSSAGNILVNLPSGNTSSPRMKTRPINFSNYDVKEFGVGKEGEDTYEEDEDTLENAELWHLGGGVALSKALLDHPVAAEYCKDVAAKALTSELVFFYLDASFQRKLKQGKKAADNLAQLIQHTYIEQGSKCEINISSSLRAKTLKMIAGKVKDPLKNAVEEVVRLLTEGAFKHWSENDPVTFKMCKRLVKQEVVVLADLAVSSPSQVNGDYSDATHDSQADSDIDASSDIGSQTTSRTLETIQSQRATVLTDLAPPSPSPQRREPADEEIDAEVDRVTYQNSSMTRMPAFTDTGLSGSMSQVEPIMEHEPYDTRGVPDQQTAS
eukprot:gb/GEZN01002716.1/.p1 GENE.gb/GEZN01002716.1/~~gb/GEZN01002716.1/.p1  ORF type:complete len:731 (+),score=93.21 gb/GEZN01002716.1/:37-2229(+)